MLILKTGFECAGGQKIAPGVMCGLETDTHERPRTGQKKTLDITPVFFIYLFLAQERVRRPPVI